MSGKLRKICKPFGYIRSIIINTAVESRLVNDIKQLMNLDTKFHIP